ncbi:MAG: type II CRISPR RNA-guided endonuclease Cas9 [Phycisphaeraceae bacterium]|nr:type II CRISPR RNA-guided endonuclease Cas9 [Phycisphaeraceae bacterium]
MNGNKDSLWVLGIDLGVASIGWSVVGLDSTGVPKQVVRTGSHLFEPGTDGTDLDRLRGADQPRNTARRTARQQRRQAWRRWRRKRALIQALVRHGLLPQPDTELRTADDVCRFLSNLDRQIMPRWVGTHDDQQRWTYRIRAAAAIREIDRLDFGRAIYQLGQRRGFKSNRRADARAKADEKSTVKAAIGDLAIKIAAHDPPTLGAYLASLTPDEVRIRHRWTGREMYEHEFDAIWQKQQSHLGLSEDARKEIRRALFWQRPLKSQKHTIGRCSLIPTERRAPIASREFQSFRILQAVNNVLVSENDAPARALTQDERRALITILERCGDTKATQAKKALALSKRSRFNIEDDGEKEIIGNRTDAKLRDSIGEGFDSLPEETRDTLVHDLRSLRTPEACQRRMARHYGFSQEQAAALSAIELEEGYASLSLKAIARLMPHMREGVTYAEARKREFPESFRAVESADSLPPVTDAFEDLRNPGVIRALTELRKLVNALVREYGKPARIRIELARELRHGAHRREQIHRTNTARAKHRDGIAKQIEKEAHISHPSREDIEKVLLADECGWRCPYTGRQIEWRTLFGASAQFHIEHIWPRSRSLDDSFLNKTLCYHEENIARKHNRTPYEAYGADDGRYGEIIERVSAFKGDLRTRRAKLERFLAQEIPEGFTNRHLSDTRYIAKLAADYLALLYGGRSDLEGNLRIQATSGGLTAWLRTGWGLSSGLLGDTPDKNRDDHRHHAIDAIVIGLTDGRAVQLLQRAAASADARFARRAFDAVDEPLPGLRDQVERLISSVIVSNQVSKRARGALHEATIYSKPIGAKHRVRKELQKLTPKEIEEGRLVDKRALAAIRAKLAELGRPDPTPQQLSQILAVPENAPMVRGYDGRMVPLRRVRVEVDAKPDRIGKGSQERYVKLGSNHHTEVWEVTDEKGRTRWEHTPVTLMEAHRRKAAKQPIVCRDGGEGRRFLFSLAKGEHIEMDDPDGNGSRVVFRVLSISENEIKVIRTFDARRSAVSGPDRTRITGSGDQLRKLKVRKVLVNYLGEIRRAND